MVDFTRLRSVAETLIAANGRDLTFIRMNQSVLPDPAKPWRGVSGPTAATATLTITIGENALPSETITIGDNVYTFVNLVVDPLDVLIGVDRDTTLGNLRTVINGNSLSNVIAALGGPGELVVTSNVLGELGNLISIATTLSDGAWDDSNLTGGLGILLTVRGAVIDYEVEDFDGTLVRRGDKRVLVAAKVVEDLAETLYDSLEFFDTMLDGAVLWKIIKVNTLEPASVRVLYDVQVRK